VGWHGLLFLPCLTGQHGTKNGPQARAWAEGQARRPMRHGVPPWPDSHRAVPARDRAVPGRAGPMPRYTYLLAKISQIFLIIFVRMSFSISAHAA